MFILSANIALLLYWIAKAGENDLARAEELAVKAYISNTWQLFTIYTKTAKHK